jgi:dTDP-4-amino-4,6-dideoxygalactose transaminase
MKVQFSYLDTKLANTLDEGHEVLENLRRLMRSGDFTLGKEVEAFEKSLAKMIGVKHALGVANGTDALRISLRMAGIRPGHEVITAANTFVASAGCIDELFATPRFVDMGDNYVLDPDLIEKAITPRTGAIIPVHFTGQACDMDKVMHVANKHSIPVIEDMCQSLMSEYNGKYVGTFGLAGAISFHPLKVLSGTGDGGAIVTNSTEFYEKCKLYRNHGLINRNQIQSPGCNSRLDTVQAIWLNYLIKETPKCLEIRQKNAAYLDQRLREIDGVYVVKRSPKSRSCYHLYFIEVEAEVRDQLVKYLNDHEIEARVHYPIPLQGMLECYGYSRKDFPNAYAQSDRIVTLPVHEALNHEQLDFTIKKVAEFFK